MAWAVSEQLVQGYVVVVVVVAAAVVAVVVVVAAWQPLEALPSQLLIVESAPWAFAQDSQPLQSRVQVSPSWRDSLDCLLVPSLNLAALSAS